MSLRIRDLSTLPAEESFLGAKTSQDAKFLAEGNLDMSVPTSEMMVWATTFQDGVEGRKPTSHHCEAGLAFDTRRADDMARGASRRVAVLRQRDGMREKIPSSWEITPQRAL
jgi:hypothetical protein